MSKKTSYPTTDALRSSLKEAIGEAGTIQIPSNVTVLADFLASIVKEYEHGTADVCDVDGVTLKQYAAVARDIFLSFLSTEPRKLTPNEKVVIEITSENNPMGYEYHEAELVDLHTKEHIDSNDPRDTYKLFASTLRDGRTINVRTYPEV
jgi:hypothetical protein